VPRTPEEDAAEGEQNREDLNGTGEYSHNARDKLVVFQVNLGKGREATDLLQKTAEEQKADVVLIQESYCYMPTWVGWTKYGGGRTDKIATLVRTGRRSIELTQFTGPTTRTVVIEGARGDIAFSNVYVPPKGPLEGTLTGLEELLASRRGKPTIIAGDLNGRHPAFGGEEEDVRGRQIIDLVGAANLVVENDRDSIPTFETANGKSWIDITLSRDATVESWAVGEEETLSDHRSISFSVDIGEAGNDQPKERKRIMMVHQADWQLFRDAAIEGKGAIFEEDSAEDMASALQGLAMRACKASIPCGIRRERKGNVWWSAKLRRIRAGVRKARSQMQGERNQERRAELRENFKKERAAYKMAIKEAKIEALRKALAQGSPEDPWGLAYKLVTSKKRGAATPWTTIQDSEGNWAGNRTETAMALIRKYFPEDDPGADTAENRETRAKRPEWSDDQAREITQQELRRTIQEKPKKKAPGIDGFPSAGLEHLFEAVGGDMLEVFNRCLKEGRFPRVWKQAEIAWIPKPGGSGLRPVCLLPTIGKVYDKILATRLTYHLEVKGRLSDRQFGFRKGRGTIEAIDKAVESLRKAKTESKHAIMVALDIRNAFNSAWYPALVQLLARSGCPGDLGRAIADFLQDRSVTSEGVTVRTSRGCPQGSCLGPILWLLIMEEWFARMDEVRAGEDVTVEVQAFADDQLVLISASSLAKLEAAWDKTWTACQLWASAHKLEYAPEKTTAIFVPAKSGLVRFGQNRRTLVRKNPRLRMGNGNIRIEEAVKYLGVVIDRGLLWVEHARYVAGKVMAAAHKVRGVAGRTWGTDPRTLREIYDGAIRPALLYGAGVWGERSEDTRIQKRLRAAQRSFLLGITRAYRTSSNVALEVLAGCVPLHIEAASAHSAWVASKSRGFEGKAVFAEGPHPAEPDRKWHELREERITGTCFWTDASCEEERTAIGVIRTEQGEIVERKGLRLQDGYPTHMAELYALGIAIKSVSGQRGTTVNFATDSRVALDMLTKRRGGTAHRIHKELMRIEREGSAVKLWWSSDQNSGIAEADRMAKRAREEPEEFPEEQAPITGRMLKKEATRAAKERWQTEWDQGEKGRMTHSIIKEVDRKLRGWNHKAVCLLTGHGPFRGYLRRFNLTETTGECICSTGAQDTAQHIIGECDDPGRHEARERWRRRQAATGGTFPFQVTGQTKEEEVKNFNRFAEEVNVEEETETSG
jgi:hypothetical protein